MTSRFCPNLRGGDAGELEHDRIDMHSAFTVRGPPRLVVPLGWSQSTYFMGLDYAPSGGGGLGEEGASLAIARIIFTI